MKTFYEKHRLGVRFLVVVLAITLCFAGSLTALAVEMPEDTSFYKIVSAASGHLSTKLAAQASKASPEDKDRVQMGGDTNNTVGNSGAFIGYCAEQEGKGVIMSWISSALSNSSATYSYETLRDVPVVGGGSTNNLYYYCRYGYLLSSLGLDKVDSSVGNAFGTLIRIVVGLVTMIVFIPCTLAGLAFLLAISVLKAINPFGWFAMVPGMSEYGLDPNAAGPLSGLAGFVSRLYMTLSSWSWEVTIPLSIVGFIATALLFNKSSKNNRQGNQIVVKARRLVTRMLCIVLAVPFCGATYTAALNNLGEASETIGANAAANVVLSTFVDFEGWCKVNNLAPPRDSAGNSLLVSAGSDSGVMGGEASALSIANLRMICETINRGSTIASETSHSGSQSGLLSSDGTWDTVTTENSTKSNIATAFDLLKRYMTGDFYYASDHEAYVKSQHAKAKNEAIAEVIDVSDDSADYENVDNVAKRYVDGLFFANGGLNATSEFVGGVPESGPPSTSDQGIRDWLKSFERRRNIAMQNVTYNTSKSDGLSDIAMFNYLTSSFGPTSVKVYSSKNSPSSLSMESHHSVNLIGNGLMSILYWANCILMMYALCYIAFGYAFSMLFANFKRSLKAISSMAGMMIGSLAAAAKFIGTFFLMISEVVITFFVYMLCSELLQGLSGIIETPMFNLLGSSDPRVAAIVGGLAGSILVMIGPILSIVMLIFFIKMAMKLRKGILKAVDTWGDEILARVINPTTGPYSRESAGIGTGAGSLPAMRQDDRNRPGLGSAIAGGLSAGTNMAMGAKMMSNGLDGAKHKGDMPGEKAPETKSAAAQRSGQDGAPTGQPGQQPGGAPMGGANGPTPDIKDGTQITGNVPTGDVAGGATGGDPTSGIGGMVAGKATDARYAENNAEQANKERGEGLMGGDNLVRSAGRHAAQAQEKEDAEIDAEHARNTTNVSAMQQEQIDQEVDREKAAARREALQKGAKAAEQTVVGVGEVAADVVTGGAAGTTKDGVKNIKNGVGGMSDAKEAGAKADTRAEQKRAELTQRQAQQNELQRNGGQSGQNGRHGESGGSGSSTSVVKEAHSQSSSYHSGGGTRGGGAGGGGSVINADSRTQNTTPVNNNSTNITNERGGSETKQAAGMTGRPDSMKGRRQLGDNQGFGTANRPGEQQQGQAQGQSQEQGSGPKTVQSMSNEKPEKREQAETQKAKNVQAAQPDNAGRDTMHQGTPTKTIDPEAFKNLGK